MNTNTQRNVGRPRERDRDQIALDLMEWAKKEDSLNVNKFCALYDPPFPPSKLSQWSKEDEEFRQSYDICKAHLAYRREEKLNSGDLHVKAYDLTAAAYDFIVKEERESHAKFEAALAANTTNQVDEMIIENFDKTMAQLDKLQSSECKMADKTINNEQKSA